MKKILLAVAVVLALAAAAPAWADGTGVVATDVITGQFIVVLKGDTGSVDWAGKTGDPTLCALTSQQAPCVVLFGVFNGINVLPNGQSGQGTPGQEGVLFGPNQVKSQ